MSDTPDTEWENFISMYPISKIEGLSHECAVDVIANLKSDVKNLLTSRDNYWKERVDRVLIAMSWREENETSEAIRVLAEIRERLVVTNEDNLK